MKKQEIMTNWLGEQTQNHLARSRALQADHRADEGNFDKIAGNVYDIFRTVLAAAEKPCQGDETAVGEFFRKRLDQIPSGWEVALQQARDHGDAKQVCVEEVKLEAIGQIREKFAQVWEGNV